MKRLLVSLAVAALGTVSTQATVLVGWNFDGGNSNASVLSTFHDSAIVQASTITKAAGLDIAGGNNGGTAWGGFRNHTAATPAAALEANDYFEFTVTPVFGGSFQITSLDLSVASREAETESRTHTFTLFSSADGFANALGSATTAPLITAYQALSINTDFLPVSSTAVTYRLAATMNGTPADFKVFWFGSSATGVNDIQVNGLIPEPGTYAMIAGVLTLVLATGFRRRRQ